MSDADDALDVLQVLDVVVGPGAAVSLYGRDDHVLGPGGDVRAGASLARLAHQLQVKNWVLVSNVFA